MNFNSIYYYLANPSGRVV